MTSIIRNLTNTKVSTFEVEEDDENLAIGRGSDGDGIGENDVNVRLPLLRQRSTQAAMAIVLIIVAAAAMVVQKGLTVSDVEMTSSLQSGATETTLSPTIIGDLSGPSEPSPSFITAPAPINIEGTSVSGSPSNFVTTLSLPVENVKTITMPPTEAAAVMIPSGVDTGGKPKISFEPTSSSILRPNVPVPALPIDSPTTEDGCRYGSLNELLLAEVGFDATTFGKYDTTSVHEYAQRQAYIWTRNAYDNVDLCNDDSLSYLVIQSYVLTLMYHQTRGVRWPSHLNFLGGSDDTVDPCQWNEDYNGTRLGVFCDDEFDARVATKIAIGVVDSFLHFGIPTELGKLTKLQELDLSNNVFQSTIPTEVGELTSLKVLSLYGSHLTGPIPSELGRLSSKLQYLYLWYNDLTGTLPTELGHLFHLETLRLENNFISGPIPSELGYLVACRELALYGNGGIDGLLPSEIGRMRSLMFLELDQNDLQGTLPSELGNLEHLQELDVFNNAFTGPLPTEMGNLSNLEKLSLHINDLTGPVPSELGNLSNLQVLSLYYNFFTGTLPAALANLQSLVEMSVLVGTDIEATIDDVQIFCGAIGSNENSNSETDMLVIWIDCDANLTTICSCCQCFDDNPDVKTANATENFVETVVPWQVNVPIGSNDENEFIRPSDMVVGGSIIGTTSASLECFDLDTFLSSFEETENTDVVARRETENWMRDQLQYLTDDQLCDTYRMTERYVLVYLYYSTAGEEWSDQLSFLMGVDPCSWNKVVNGTSKGVFCSDDTIVTKIKLPENGLQLQMPDCIGKLSHLQVLDLSFNENLQGAIPSQVGNMFNLVTLNLQESRLSGTLPTEIGKLTSLERFKAWYNELSGRLPSELGNLGGLIKLRLEGNALTGPIPSDLGRLTQLRELYLYTNLVTGTIPTYLGLMESIEYLHLDTNNMTGTVPTEFGYLDTLVELELFANALTGPIPSELGAMESLEDFQIHYNDLTGSIPSELGLLTNLQTFSAYYNFLTGNIPESFENLNNLQWLNTLTGTNIEGGYDFLCEVINVTITVDCAQEATDLCSCCQC